MKLNFIVLILLLSYSSMAQVYNLNTSVPGFICTGTGIDATYGCTISSNDTLELGSFIDVNENTDALNSISLTVYGACSGNLEFFLNSVSLVSGTASGLSCTCQSIESDPNIPQLYTI